MKFNKLVLSATIGFANVAVCAVLPLSLHENWPRIPCRFLSQNVLAFLAFLALLVRLVRLVRLARLARLALMALLLFLQAVSVSFHTFPHLASPLCLTFSSALYCSPS
jgi:hypothetical protein